MSADPTSPTRTALLTAAREELREHGADGLRLRAIARRAGVSHAAPGYLFGGLQGVLTALATEGFTLLAERLEAVGASGPGPGPLGALGEAYVGFAAAEPALFTLMFRPALLDGADPTLQEARHRAFAPLDRLGVDRTEAVMIWAVAHGAASLERDGQLPLVLDGPDPAAQVVRAFAARRGS